MHVRSKLLKRMSVSGKDGCARDARPGKALSGTGQITQVTPGRQDSVRSRGRGAFGSYFLVAFLAFKDAFSAFAAEWFLLWRARAFAISSEESLLWLSECKTSFSGLVFVGIVNLTPRSDMDRPTSAAG